MRSFYNSVLPWSITPHNTRAIELPTLWGIRQVLSLWCMPDCTLIFARSNDTVSFVLWCSILLACSILETRAFNCAGQTVDNKILSSYTSHLCGFWQQSDIILSHQCHVQYQQLTIGVFMSSFHATTAVIYEFTPMDISTSISSYLYAFISELTNWSASELHAWRALQDYYRGQGFVCHQVGCYLWY